jgi:hypothetical protein
MVRPQSVLTAERAREIFESRSKLGVASLHSVSVLLAEKYHVSSKAIRDIWTGRSWLHATFDLWNSDERPPRKIVGRPKGKKDSKPRLRANCQEFSSFSKNVDYDWELKVQDCSDITMISSSFGRPASAPVKQYEFPVLPSINSVLKDCIASFTPPLQSAPLCCGATIQNIAWQGPWLNMSSVSNTIPEDSIFLYLADQLKTSKSPALATASPGSLLPIDIAEHARTILQETHAPATSSMFLCQRGPALAWLNA